MILKDKVSIITGAANGIGRSIAILFAKEGSTVFLSDINKEELKKIENYISNMGFTCFSFITNVGKYIEVKKMYSFIDSKVSKIDILVNNAGILKDKTLMKLSSKIWNEVIKTNLTSVYYCTKEAVVKMSENNYGRIINMTSVMAIRGNFGQTCYSASKAGIIGFTKSLAYEVALKGITVNAIAPGFIETDMMKNIPDNVKDNYLKNIPMKKFGEPDDIANAALFLASNNSKYITGQVFNVNGGYLMQ